MSTMNTSSAVLAPTSHLVSASVELWWPHISCMPLSLGSRPESSPARLHPSCTNLLIELWRSSRKSRASATSASLRGLQPSDLRSSCFFHRRRCALEATCADVFCCRPARMAGSWLRNEAEEPAGLLGRCSWAVGAVAPMVGFGCWIPVVDVSKGVSGGVWAVMTQTGGGGWQLCEGLLAAHVQGFSVQVQSCDTWSQNDSASSPLGPLRGLKWSGPLPPEH